MGAIISEGINSIYYELIDNTFSSKIYNREFNVIPYTPDRIQQFIDFFPDLWNPSSDTYLRIFLNNVEIARVKIVDAFGFIYCNIDPPLGIFEVKVKSDNYATTYVTYSFTSLNLYLYYEMLGEQFGNNRVALEKIKGDLYSPTVRNEKIYDNFGTYVKTRKPEWLEFSEYRNWILGDSPFIGIYKSSFFGSTYKGIKEAIAAITGQYPTITSQRNRKGWIINDISAGQELYDYVIDSSLGNNPPIILSGKYRRFTILITVNNSIRNVVDENIQMTVVDGSNYLAHAFLTAGIVTIVGYTETVHFTVNRTTGLITWLTGPQPVVGSIYLVSYSYYLKEEVETIANEIKPAHINLRFEYV